MRRTATYSPDQRLKRMPVHDAVCSAGGTHHFIIDTPTGPTADGRCKKCGEQRVYPSWIADMPFEALRLEGTKFQEVRG